MRRRALPRVGALALALALTPVATGPAVAGPLLAARPSLTAAGAQCDSNVTRYIDRTPSALERLSARRAWGLATGRGVVVAVVGSGVNVGNAHLKEAVLPGTDFVPPPPDDQYGDLTKAQQRALDRQRDLAAKGWWDESGHGTAIAGQIAARQVDRSGLLGLARDSKILPVRVYASTDSSAEDEDRGPDVGRMAQGIRWAADHGADIINVSMSSTIDDPALHAAVRYATRKHALVVASAGNRATTEDKGDSPRYPAAYPEVLGVAATDTDDRVTNDSIHGPHVDLAAPGTDVLTTFWAAGDCVLSSSDQSSSYATAYVSASAALVADHFPDESPAQWRYRLEVSASRPDRAQRDNRMGWGVVQPYAALTFVVDGSAPGPRAPGQDPAPRTTPQPLALDLGVRADAREPARNHALWWGLGGLTAMLGLGLTARMVRLRRRGGDTTP